MEKERIIKIIKKYDKHKDCKGLSIKINNSYGDSVSFYSDGIARSRQFFIASTTKLFTTALCMKLIEMGKFTFETPIPLYLGGVSLEILHQYKGVDSTQKITLKNLLSHTSGLPDYFEQKPSWFKNSLGQNLFENGDCSWDFKEVIEHTRNLKCHFYPGEPGKAFYSDTNYQILGQWVSELFGASYEDCVKNEISTPLGLNSTLLFSLKTIDCFSEIAPFYFGQKKMNIPKAMTSFGADGSVVSTTDDLEFFLKSFFEGRELFNSSKIIPILTHQWNKLFFPLEYGIGIMQYRVPWIFSPFRKVPAIIGHSGASGAFAFYIPDKKTTVVGTVNQVKNRALSFRMLSELLFYI